MPRMHESPPDSGKVQLVLPPVPVVRGKADPAPSNRGEQAQDAGRLDAVRAQRGRAAAACEEQPAPLAAYWPGREFGVRQPAAGETALSPQEIEILTGKKLSAMERLSDYDHLDTFPVVHRFVPSHSWGVYKPGLRYAQPFDGLVQS